MAAVTTNALRTSGSLSVNVPTAFASSPASRKTYARAETDGRALQSVASRTADKFRLLGVFGSLKRHLNRNETSVSSGSG